MISRSRPSSVPRLGPPPVIEEYTLDERELAALEQLYDFPGRASLAATSVASATSTSNGATSGIRATSIIETLSEMASAGHGAPLGQLVRETVRDRVRSPPGERVRSAQSERARSSSGDRMLNSHGERVRSPLGDRARSSQGERMRSPHGERVRSPPGDRMRSPHGERMRTPQSERGASDFVRDMVGDVSGASRSDLGRETTSERSRLSAGEMNGVASPKLNTALSNEHRASGSERAGERATLPPPSAAEQRQHWGDMTTRAPIDQRTPSQSRHPASQNAHPSAIHGEKARDPPTQRRPVGGGLRRGSAPGDTEETGGFEMSAQVNGDGGDAGVEMGSGGRGEASMAAATMYLDSRAQGADVSPRQQQQQRQQQQHHHQQQQQQRRSDSRHSEPLHDEPRSWPGPPPPGVPPPGCEDAIARLLEAAARSPAPPVPSRRPDLTRLNLPRRSRGRGQRRAPPSDRRDSAPAEPTDRVSAVFDLAREGSVTKLDVALSSIDPATARGMADQHGNTVAHVLAACGHVEALTWLADTCSHGMEELLWRENARGLTPCLAAVRCGRLEVVQWLADRSPAKSRLLPGDGVDSLLHYAARHGQVEIVGWCADHMFGLGCRLDGADGRRDTPLHLAAGGGNTLVCRALLDRGASVTARNACGLKPYDVAAQTGHHACAEYLLTFETLADLAGDFCSLEAETARLGRDNADYKDNFREVLSVARRLLRERGELHAALQQLRDDWQLLHERLLRQLQLAAAERRQLREQLRGADQLPGDEDDDQLSAEPEQLAGELSELLERWQHCGSQAAEIQFAESQARLQAAETLWHRLRGARKEPAQPLTDAQEIVRNKIGDIRAQAAPGRPLDASAFSGSDDDSLIEAELLQGAPPPPPPRPPGCAPPQTSYNTHVNDSVPPHSRFTPVSSDRTSTPVKANLERSFDSGVSGGPANSSFQALSVDDSSRLSRGRSPRSTQLRRRGKSADPIERTTLPDSVEDGIGDGSGALWPSGELSRSLDWTEPSPRRRPPAPSANTSAALARAELRQRLRQLALVSESGSAAVLDVIEPSGSEMGSGEDLVRREVEAQRRARARSAPPPRSGADASGARSSGELTADEDLNWPDEDGGTVSGDDMLRGDGGGEGDGVGQPPAPPQWRTTLRPDSPGRCLDTNSSERRGRPGRSSRSSRSSRTRLESENGPTTAGSDGQPAGEERTPASSGALLSAPDILQGTRHWRDLDDSDEASPEKSDPPLFQLGNTTPSAAAAVAAAAAAASDSNAGKKRSFLQKFSIRARWATPKKRDRPARPGQEITAVDFRETYSSETRDDTLSVHESLAQEEADEPPPPLLPRASTGSAESGRTSRESRSSQGSEVRPPAELCDAGSENSFLAGGGTTDLFTAVCVNTYADSASESSRSAVSRRSREGSSPGRPLLSGGQPPYRPTDRQPAAATAAATAAVATGSDATSTVAPAPGGASGGSAPTASRPASSASAVPPGSQSPAASEFSRTESALAPASDVSVTESARHLQAAAGPGGATVRTAGGAAGGKAGAARQPAATGQKTPRADGAPVPPPAGQAKLVSMVPENGARQRRTDRPWYEISDDD